MITATPQGLSCAAGGFHIDPWEPVELAVLTHAHGDHCRPGSTRYLAAAPGAGILARRLPDARVDVVPYGHRVSLGETTISFHPAGHVLGSAQVRVERGGETWVVSGDYKRDPDPTCAPFEPVRCDVFVTEATFALPVYRWDPPAAVAKEILGWWDAGVARKRASVLHCYALGKAQRILAELSRLTDRPVFVHGAIEPLVEIYRAAGVAMLPTRVVAEKRDFAGELILAPKSAIGTPWMKRFGECETAFASGHMRVRGNRRRGGYDRGFVLSDHADWPAILRTIEETGARRVLATHGHSEPLARWLRERGLDAAALPTAWGDEEQQE